MVDQRRRVSYGSPLEGEIGFCRGVRSGSNIAVSGTAPIAEGGGVHGRGDVYAQTLRCLEIISDVLSKAGGSLRHVIRTRIYLTNADDWKKAAAAHGEYFADIKPACTFVEVSRFIDPLWLVEVEADAIVDD